LRQAAIVAQAEPYRALQPPPEHDHAPLAAPTHEPNLALLRLEALAGVDPLARRGELLDHALDVGGQPQLQEKRKLPRLRLAHDLLVAEAAVAA
jgi:hypothetical protein